MIFDTNRTMSLGTIDVDVNESYFGAGALNFMQENAEIELELFEAAIKSDIDEYLIGESTYELEALNEGFLQNAAKKIKEIMTKFIEWLRAIMRSAYAKLTQIFVRDNEKFCKEAEKRIITMKNSDKFKYSGKAIIAPVSVSFKFFDNQLDILRKLWNDASSKDTIDGNMDGAIDECKKKIDEEINMEKLEKAFFTEVEDAGLSTVNGHLIYLKKRTRDNLKSIKDNNKNFEKFANDIIKKAKELEKKSNDSDDDNKKNKASALASIASFVKSEGQSIINAEMSLIKKLNKVARTVVSKAMGATPKNEGFEYTEELIDAMIETSNYEIEEAMEEMSEGKECDPGDISDCEDDDEE